jgi:DNA-binding NtrC family response regulator
MTDHLASAPTNARVACPGPSCQATILVVDDRAADRELFAHVLQRAGYRVLVADGAEQAQRVVAEQARIDLVVMDVEMPATNGVDLAGWFRSRSPLCKVLLVSDAAWESAGHLEAPGWPGVLDKTRALSQLDGMVRRLLAEASTGTEGFGAAEAARRGSAEAMVLGQILERGKQSRACA